MTVLRYDRGTEAPPVGAPHARPANRRDVDLLTVGEVARQLRVDSTTVRRWIVLGTLEAVVLPHRGKQQSYRIRQSTLDAILQSHAQGEGRGRSQQ